MSHRRLLAVVFTLAILAGPGSVALAADARTTSGHPAPLLWAGSIVDRHGQPAPARVDALSGPLPRRSPWPARGGRPYLDSPGVTSAQIYSGDCTFSFSVDDVPEEDFYGISISHRGKMSYSRAEMESRNWEVSLSLG